MSESENRLRALRGLKAMRASTPGCDPTDGYLPYQGLEYENIDNLGFVGQVRLTHLLSYLRHTAQVGGLDFVAALELSGEWFVAEMAEEL